MHFIENEVEMCSVIRPELRDQNLKKLIVLDLCRFFNEHDIEKVKFCVNKCNVANVKALEGINAVSDEKYAARTKDLGYSDHLMYVLDPKNVMYVKHRKK